MVPAPVSPEEGAEPKPTPANWPQTLATCDQVALSEWPGMLQQLSAPRGGAQGSL
jgi:hypothetical protein